MMGLIYACNSQLLRAYMRFFLITLFRFLIHFFCSLIYACKIVTPLFSFCKQSVVCDVQQAEALIAQGMLKRATAMTNSNSQSRCVHFVCMCMVPLFVWVLKHNYQGMVMNNLLNHKCFLCSIGHSIPIRHSLWVTNVICLPCLRQWLDFCHLGNLCSEDYVTWCYHWFIVLFN